MGSGKCLSGGSWNCRKNKLPDLHLYFCSGHSQEELKCTGTRGNTSTATSSARAGIAAVTCGTINFCDLQTSSQGNSPGGEEFMCVANPSLQIHLLFDLSTRVLKGNCEGTGSDKHCYLWFCSLPSRGILRHVQAFAWGHR